MQASAIDSPLAEGQPRQCIPISKKKRAVSGQASRTSPIIDELRKTAEELDAKTLDPSFWTLEDSSKILQKIKQTKDVISGHGASPFRVQLRFRLCATVVFSPTLRD